MTEDITVYEANKVVEAIKNNSRSDGEAIYLGNFLEIKPVYMYDKDNNKTLEAVDIYRYQDPEVMEDDEDYDFDSDYITTVYLNQ